MPSTQIENVKCGNEWCFAQITLHPKGRWLQSNSAGKAVDQISCDKSSSTKEESLTCKVCFWIYQSDLKQSYWLCYFMKKIYISKLFFPKFTGLFKIAQYLSNKRKITIKRKCYISAKHRVWNKFKLVCFIMSLPRLIRWTVTFPFVKSGTNVEVTKSMKHFDLSFDMSKQIGHEKNKHKIPALV